MPVANRMDNRIQTVNMGQAPLGIDQAYLWYERDGSKLDVDLHIMAFIYAIARMTFTSHWGYGKPILVVENEGSRSGMSLYHGTIVWYRHWRQAFYVE